MMFVPTNIISFNCVFVFNIIIQVNYVMSYHYFGFLIKISRLIETYFFSLFQSNLSSFKYFLQSNVFFSNCITVNIQKRCLVLIYYVHLFSKYNA